MRCQVTANSQAKLFAVVDFEYMLQSIRVFNGRKGISESMVKLSEIIDICSETSKQLIIKVRNMQFCFFLYSDCMYKSCQGLYIC